MLIHCRIATGGKIDTHNSHPHVINDTCVMIHNGIIHNLPSEKDNSDTVIYCRDILSKFSTDDLMHNEGLKTLIQRDIGAGNKFVFLNNLGEYVIINEKAGNWKDGVWYSNYSYIPRQIVKYETKEEKKNTLDTSYSNWWKKTDSTSKFNYGWGDFDDVVVDDNSSSLLPKDKRAEIFDFIENLTEEQALTIGIYPVVSKVSSQVLVSGNISSINSLEELDEELFDKYLKKVEELNTDDNQLLEKIDIIGELGTVENLKEEVDLLEKDDFISIGTSDVKFDTLIYFNAIKGVLLKDLSAEAQDLYVEKAKSFGLDFDNDGKIFNVVGQSGSVA